jgi:hypothetical protein
MIFAQLNDVPALYQSGPTITAQIWKIYARARRVSFPAPIFENPSGPIFIFTRNRVFTIYDMRRTYLVLLFFEFLELGLHF